MWSEINKTYIIFVMLITINFDKFITTKILQHKCTSFLTVGGNKPFVFGDLCLMKNKWLDIAGKVFGRLTVLKDAGSDKNGTRLWMCECICGVTKVISGNSLRKGNTKSCGCFHSEQILKSITTHGQAGVKNKRTSEYCIWTEMKYRCVNPNHKYYKNYGGRGIKVCERWLGENGFSNFLYDMGKKPSKNHSIDRFPNNDGNYEPSNCRWATSLQQNRNTRFNRWIEYNGENKIISEWANILHVDASNISRRLKTDSFESVYNFYKNKNTSNVV